MIKSFTSTVIEVKRVKEAVSKVERIEKKNSSRFIIVKNSEETDSRDYMKPESISFCIVKEESEEKRVCTVSIK